ncbi:MAG: hypothetical protein NT031_14830 [Planctomycetota bacterium]|nr:hypothetical protein [Planctomycetota bacterium]
MMKHALVWSVVTAFGLFGTRAVAQVAMPAPDEEFLRALAADSAASKPAAGTGTLIVRVTQGTKDGPKVGGETVVVELYCEHGKVEKRLEGVVDAAGLATFPGEIPVGDEKYQPVVTVMHAGFPYQVRGEAVGGDSPDPVIKVPVYETTAAAPPWTIMARHVVIIPLPEGLGVTEKLVVVNPTDRTWLPAQVNSKALATVVLPLPPGAVKPEILDIAPQPVPGNAAGGQLFLANPVPPGVSRISLQYIVPVVDGGAKMELKAPANTASMLIVVPTAGVDVKGDTLTPQALEVKDLRGYLAPELKAGETLQFTLAVPVVRKDGLSAGRWFTMIGLGVLALLVIVGILVKVARSPGPIKHQDPEAPSP